MTAQRPAHRGRHRDECGPDPVSCDVKRPEQAQRDTFGMDQNAHCDLMAARLANQKPHLLALAEAGHPHAFDQAWNLLDPIFVDAERHGLGSRCYHLIGLLLAETGLNRRLR